MKNTREKKVVTEIRRRAKTGSALNSGANRGDWLYAMAIREFGTWGAAVEACGYQYDSIKRRPLTKTEVTEALKRLSRRKEPMLAKHHPRLAGAARRHFGSWARAMKAAGLTPPSHRKWTEDAVIKAIKDDRKAGLPLNPMAVVQRNMNLYAAARRRFGSWDGAIRAAKVPASAARLPQLNA